MHPETDIQSADRITFGSTAQRIGPRSVRSMIERGLMNCGAPVSRGRLCRLQKSKTMPRAFSAPASLLPAWGRISSASLVLTARTCPGYMSTQPTMGAALDGNYCAWVSASLAHRRGRWCLLATPVLGGCTRVKGSRSSALLRGRMRAIRVPVWSWPCPLLCRAPQTEVGKGQRRPTADSRGDLSWRAYSRRLGTATTWGSPDYDLSTGGGRLPSALATPQRGRSAW